MRWDLGRELAVAAKLSSACIAESGAEYIIASALSMMRSASGLAQPESISAMVVDSIIVMCRIVVGWGREVGAGSSGEPWRAPRREPSGRGRAILYGLF